MSAEGQRDIDAALSEGKQDAKPTRKPPFAEPIFLDEDEDGNLSF